MLHTSVWATLSVVLLIGTVSGWHWVGVNQQPIEQRIGYIARRIVQPLILISGLAISAAAGIVVVSRVGTTGTMVSWTQGEMRYSLPVDVLLSAAEFLAIAGFIGLGIGLLAGGFGLLSQKVTA